MLTITHSYQSGTLIEGTLKGDGTAEVLKTQRWRWSRSISAWYMPYTRDHLPNHYRISQTVKALEVAGFEVATKIDETTMATNAAEADKADRAASRAAGLDAKAERKQSAAEAAWAAQEHQRQIMPPMGEPIKVGHHSEKRHRKAFEDMRRLTRQAVETQRESDHAAERAEIAAHATERRYNPVTVQNRIEKLEADLRRVQRSLAGRWDYIGPCPPTAPEWAEAKEDHPELWLLSRPDASRIEWLEARRAELTDQIAYWQGVRAQQKASGLRAYGQEDVHKGDLVQTRFGWYKVTRVNKKTVSVEGLGFTIEYVKIMGVKQAN